MLLRSVMSHVRDQNWTAVFIDFLIVVIGVYMGIEVSNWNEQREEVRRSAEYLERLEDDLNYNITELEKRMVYWTAVAREGRLALAYAEQGKLADDSAWATLRAFFHASQVWRFIFNDTTYTEMRSAGELSLIPSQRIRAQLANYYVAVAPRRGEGMYLLLPQYRETVRAAMPSHISRHYWQFCDTQDVSGQTISDCDSPVDEGEAAEILDGLIKEPGLVNQLRYWIDTLELIVRLAENDVSIAQDLAAQVAATRR